MRLYQSLIYASLFVFLFSSLGLLITYLVGYADDLWKWYYWAYIILALGQTWFVLILLCIGDFRTRKYAKYAGEKIAVIVPCYNEEPVLLKQALASMVAAEGNKDIFVIDDGSTKPGVREMLIHFSDRYSVKAYTCDKNRGKRAVLHGAVSELLENHEFVVMVDSDTVLDPKALVRIVAPLKTPEIGAVSGDIRLLNENDNLLTRMIAAYYWVSIHVQRKAQSTIGSVSCCSGALSAYKAAAIRPIIDDYIKEEFLGERCKHLEDRHLTNLVLKQGYDVVLVPEAVAYTYSPSTYRAFLRQQLRWRRGIFQESTFVLTNLWGTCPILCMEVLIWEVVLPFLSFGIVVMMVLTMFFNPIVVPILCMYLAVLVVIRNLPAILSDRRRVFSLLLFSFFSSFVMYWQGAYALFTLRNMKWGTR